MRVARPRGDGLTARSGRGSASPRRGCAATGTPAGRTTHAGDSRVARVIRPQCCTGCSIRSRWSSRTRSGATGAGRRDGTHCPCSGSPSSSRSSSLRSESPNWGCPTSRCPNSNRNWCSSSIPTSCSCSQSPSSPSWNWWHRIRRFRSSRWWPRSRPTPRPTRVRPTARRWPARCEGGCSLMGRPFMSCASPARMNRHDARCRANLWPAAERRRSSRTVLKQSNGAASPAAPLLRRCSSARAQRAWDGAQGGPGTSHRRAGQLDGALRLGRTSPGNAGAR